MKLKHLAVLGALIGAAAAPAFAQTSTTAPATTMPTMPTMPAKPGTMSTGTMAPAATAAAKPATTAATTAAKNALPAAHSVNINTASEAQLDALPQIGKKRAAKIIENRPYKTTDELVSKKALTPGIYSKIKDYITI